MKIILDVLLLAVFASMGFATRLVAAQEQGKEQANTTVSRWSGAIQQMDKENLTLTVRHRDGRTKVIHYTASTKWTNKAGATVDSAKLKEGDRIVCLGKYEGDKFLAAEVILQQ
jgi:Cu/Ag efflux protein CusF